MLDGAGHTSLATVSAPAGSATMAVNELARERRMRGERVIHLGFGDAGLPVPTEMSDALSNARRDGSYGAVCGSERLRATVADFLGRRRVSAAADTVIVSPGSKAALMALALVLPGDVVVTQPSWVTYAGQAALLGKRAIRVRTASGVGGLPDPEALEDTVREARAEGAEPTLLVITNPDNPTATNGSVAQLQETIEVARTCELNVVSDEIYQDLVHEPGSFVSAATIDPGHVFTTGGLSKSLSVGGWRLGYLRAPATDFGRAVIAAVGAVGSQTWSCLPGPLAAAAEVGFGDSEPITNHVATSRGLHAQVIARAYEVLHAVGAECLRPTSAFYAYPDFERFRDVLGSRGVHTSQQLAETLFERFGVLVLPGSAFGEPAEALRMRVSTSMLYGNSDAERWETYRAGQEGTALSLARVAEPLEQFGDALSELLG
jgi:aspartate aminotransferase